MDLNKIMKRNREVAVTQAVMTVEIPVSIETVRVSSEQTVALAVVGQKIVIVSERGEQAVTTLEMTGEEFVSFIQSLQIKAEKLGLIQKAAPKPPTEKRAYTRRNVSPPKPVEAPPVENSPVEASPDPVTPSAEVVTVLDTFAEAKSLSDKLALDAANEVKGYDMFGPEAL